MASANGRDKSRSEDGPVTRAASGLKDIIIKLIEFLRYVFDEMVQTRDRVKLILFFTIIVIGIMAIVLIANIFRGGELGWQDLLFIAIVPCFAMILIVIIPPDDPSLREGMESRREQIQPGGLYR